MFAHIRPVSRTTTSAAGLTSGRGLLLRRGTAAERDREQSSISQPSNLTNRLPGIKTD